MGYAYKVNKVTISGDMFTSNEVWQTGFFMGYDNGDVEDPEGCADDIGGHWATFFNNSLSDISTNYRTLQVKVSTLNTDGKTDLERIDYYDYPTPILGAETGANFPPQVTLAATLTSDVQRGLASKGRMYIPGVMSLLSNAGNISSTTVANGIATTLKTFLDAVNADADVPGRVILASKGHAIWEDATKRKIVGYANPRNTLVTGIRVGNVYDTQRRRRNGIPETYSSKVIEQGF